MMILQLVFPPVLFLLVACGAAPRLELTQADYSYRIKAGVVHGSLLDGGRIPVFNVTKVAIGGSVSDPAIQNGKFRIISTCGEVVGDFPIYDGKFSFDPSKAGWFPDGCDNWNQTVRLIVSVTDSERRSASREMKLVVDTAILD